MPPCKHTLAKLTSHYLEPHDGDGRWQIGARCQACGQDLKIDMLRYVLVRIPGADEINPDEFRIFPSAGNRVPA